MHLNKEIRLRDWGQFATGFKLTDTGRTSLRKMVKSFGIQAVASAMKEAVDQYLRSMIIKFVEPDKDKKKN
jgi:hypothetical protein